MSLETLDRDDRDWWEGKAARERRMQQFRPHDTAKARLHAMMRVVTTKARQYALLIIFIIVALAWNIIVVL
jgi:hypothetical protein